MLAATEKLFGPQIHQLKLYKEKLSLVLIYSQNGGTYKMAKSIAEGVQEYPNTKAILKAIKDAKPEGSKGKFIKEFFLSSTMGPSVQVVLESF